MTDSDTTGEPRPWMESDVDRLARELHEQGERSQTTEGWWLDINNLSPLAADTLRAAIRKAKHSHITNLVLRLNGQDVCIEADWVKYLEECFEDGSGKSA